MLYFILVFALVFVSYCAVFYLIYRFVLKLGNNHE